MFFLPLPYWYLFFMLGLEIGLKNFVQKFWDQVWEWKTVFPHFGIENGNEKQCSPLKLGKKWLKSLVEKIGTRIPAYACCLAVVTHGCLVLHVTVIRKPSPFWSSKHRMIIQFVLKLTMKSVFPPQTVMSKFSRPGQSQGLVINSFINSISLFLPQLYKIKSNIGPTH